MGERIGHSLGNYRLIQLLGRGGFAEVYLAEHRYLKSYAALKILHTSLNHEDVERFLVEAQTLVQLKHPHIVRVLDFGMEQGTPVLVMDYAPGGTMRQRCAPGTRLAPATVAAFITQIAAALQYAHNRSVIHRDVKPENILFGAEQQLLLGDFGLALLAPSPEQISTQEMAGSLPYIAPEQLRGKPTFASDQYALAVIAYEWLSGRRPFEGTAWELMQQHMEQPPPLLRAVCPDLPAALETVLQRALAKEPRQRFVGVQAFAQALERACQHDLLEDEDASQTTAPLKALTRPSQPTPPSASLAETQTPGSVFVCAASTDLAFARRLSDDLKARGILLATADVEALSHTQDAQDAVREAIRRAARVLVVVTPQMRASRLVKEHLRIAQTYQRRLVFVWAAGDEMAAVLLDAWGNSLPVDVIDAREQRYDTALEELVVSLKETTMSSAPLLMHSLATPPAEPRNPYKGLRAFRREDAADFFGRDALSEQLVQHVQELLAAQIPGRLGGRLLTVVGPSGSGKSSVVMAGLLPRLQAGALPGSDRWIYLDPLLPGIHPLESLLLTLAPHLPERSLWQVREDLEGDSTRGLHLLATHLTRQSGAKVVLLVDQFEEVFTQTISEQERQQFLDLLLTAATEPQGPVVVLLTLRADFSDRPIQYPEFGQMIEAHQLTVYPMELPDLRAVITQPAQLPDVQLFFEGNLVGDLLFETQGQVGALPLLAFTLEQLFQQREGQWLTMQAYQRIGGVKGALTTHAEATYTALPSEEHRVLARALFLRLIEPGMTEQDTTRRRVILPEMELPDARETAILQETANWFVTARLLTTNQVQGTVTVEVSHEALIREWTRLSTWLREAREDIHLQHAISQDAAEWERAKRPADRLYRGTQFKEALAWTRRNTTSKQEQAFLRASAAGQRRSLLVVVVVLLLVFASSGLAGWFFLKQAHAPDLVTTTDDNATGSLRWAIGTAHPGDTITFDPSMVGQTIIVQHADLHIFQQHLTIEGPTTGHITIREIEASFVVDRPASATISDLVFQGSKTNNQSSLIWNLGTLALKQCIISGNTVFNAIGGGGILNDDGMLTITNSTISGNTASRGQGGGIFNTVGVVTITNSTISGNTASSGFGGGISNGSAGAVTITNSTISSNTASSGGGIFNMIGTLTIINSTISGNRASGNGGNVIYGGGGILVTGFSDGRPAPAVTLLFCTIVNNSASSGDGFDIASVTSVDGGLIPLSLKASIVGGSDVQHNPIAGLITSEGYNMIQQMSSTNFVSNAAHATDRSVQDLTGVLGSSPRLQMNGGPTQTYQLVSGASNPAINDVPLAACTDAYGRRIVSDQRGMPRPGRQKRFCDSGAYESQGASAS